MINIMHIKNIFNHKEIRKNKSYKNAFTLVEIVLYIGLVGIILLALSSFFTILIETRIRNQVISEIYEQGSQITQIISLSIRNSTSIVSPTTGNTSTTTLSLNEPTRIKSPTIFTISSSTLNITEGVSSSILLTSNKVKISNMSFSNVSLPSTVGSIKFKFTLIYINPDNKQIFNYSETFYGSATVR